LFSGAPVRPFSCMMKEIKTDLNSKNITEQIKVTYCPVDHFAHKMVVKTWELDDPPDT
jgi:hypothetical protein